MPRIGSKPPSMPKTNPTKPGAKPKKPVATPAKPGKTDTWKPGTGGGRKPGKPVE